MFFTPTCDKTGYHDGILPPFYVQDMQRKLIIRLQTRKLIQTHTRKVGGNGEVGKESCE